MLAAWVVVSLAAVVVGLDVGTCPTPKVFPNFDLEKFSGKWYEIEASLSFDKVRKKCSSWIIEFRETGKAGLMHKYVSSVTGKTRSDYSDITSPKKKEMAKMVVTPLKGNVLEKKHDFYILDTDYSNYAVAFSCRSSLLTHKEGIQILSRTKSMDDKTKMDIYNTLKDRSLSQKNLAKVDQTNKVCEEL